MAEAPKERRLASSNTRAQILVTVCSNSPVGSVVARAVWGAWQFAGFVAVALTFCWSDVVLATKPYQLPTAHAEGKGTLKCRAPRSGWQHVAIVFRDTYGVRENYKVSGGGAAIGSFDANLTDGDLLDGSRFWVWFSPQPHDLNRGDELRIDYAADGAGLADILEIFFVKGDQIERLKAIIAQPSIVARGAYLYTKLVNHYDHYTWQKLKDNKAWVRIEAASGCKFVEGFKAGTAEGTTRSVFADLVIKPREVNTWTFVEPAKGTLTKPIVTMKCRFDDPRLYDGQEFWIATRGTTKHGVSQLSPMFPQAAIDPLGTQKGEIDRCTNFRTQNPGQDPRFGGEIDWAAGKTIYVIAHLGIDHYGRHREGTLKGRPKMDKERTMTAYMIRVSDGTPESNKFNWPLFYWNSWFHRSDGQPLDEELTRRYARVNDERMWFFMVGRPQWFKKYIAERDIDFLNKQSRDGWGPNSYIMYRIAQTSAGGPRFIPYGHYLKPFPDAGRGK